MSRLVGICLSTPLSLFVDVCVCICVFVLVDIFNHKVKSFLFGAIVKTSFFCTFCCLDVLVNYGLQPNELGMEWTMPWNDARDHCVVHLF